MKKTILLVLCLLACICVKASVTYSPQPYDYDDYVFRYKILSETDKTIAVVGMAHETYYKGESVTVPSTTQFNGVTYTVTTIGYKAFYMDNFTSFTMPNTVTVIENDAFNGADIDNMTLSTSLRKIGDQAFLRTSPTYGNTSAGTLRFVIPSTVEYVGRQAFGGPAFISVDLSRTKITELNQTFYGATNMTSVSLPSTITVLKDNAFRNCIKLNTINFNGAKITEINAYAFSNCQALTSFIVPEGVKELGTAAFGGCTSMTTLSLPASLESFTAEAVNFNNYAINTMTLQEIKVAGGNTSLKVQDGMLLNRYGTRLLWVPCNVKNIVIPNGVQTIEKYAVTNNQQLETLVVPEGVFAIATCAFDNCTQLKSVKLPTSLRSIENYAFRNTAIEHIDIPASVGNMASGCWENCRQLKEVNIPVSSMLTQLYIYNVNAPENRQPGVEKATCRTIVLPEGCTGANFTDNDFVSALDTIYVMNPFMNAFNGNFTESINPEAVIACFEPFAKNIKSKWKGKIKVMDPCPYYVNYEDTYVSYEKRTFYSSTPTSVSFKVYHGAYISWNADSTTYQRELVPWPENADHKLIGVRFQGKILEGSDHLFDNVVNCQINNLEPGTSYEAEIVYETGGKQYAWPIAFRTQEVVIPNYPKTGTQTTAIFRASGTMDDIIEWGVIYKGQEWSAKENGFVTITGLQPNSNITIEGYYAKTANKTYYPYVDNTSYLSASTKPVIRNIQITNVGSTSMRLKGNITQGDATIIGTSIYLKKLIGENTWEEIGRWQGDSVVVSSLQPETRYICGFEVITSDGGKKTHIITNDNTLPALELTMRQPQVGKNGITVFTATTNMTEDERHAGFEWIKYDAPEAVAPKQGYAIIYDGVMAGQVTDLSKTYYKVRAFCEMAGGQRVYTDWLTFDADEYSTFQPIVHTSPDQQIVDAGITVTGYVTSGSETIIEQGFEYWIEGTTGDTRKVKLNGQQLITTLTQLTPGTTYIYRVYVTTASGTFYGEEQHFTTPVATGVETPKEKGKVTIEGYYDLNGHRINGLNDKGMTIIRMSDGSSKKVMRK